MNKSIKVIDSRVWQKTFRHQHRLEQDDLVKVTQPHIRLRDYFRILYRSMFKENLGEG